MGLIDAERLDYYHRLERERIHLLLIDDARRGLKTSRLVAATRPMQPWQRFRNAAQLRYRHPEFSCQLIVDN